MRKSRKKKHYTLPLLIIWLAAVPAVIIVQILTKFQLPSVELVTAAGLVTFAYMGLEYSADYFKNGNLPMREGSIEKIEQHRVVVYLWVVYLLGGLIAQIFTDNSIPLIQLSIFAGAISVAYVTGNKANKIAIAKGGPSNEGKGEEK